MSLQSFAVDVPGAAAAGPEPLRVGSLCSGYEGLGLAVQAVMGGELAWVADNDPGATAILAHHFPDVPNLGDITATDWAAVEPVDVLTAGFPCQDVSCAGGRAGLREGNRTGVWAYVARAIDTLRPSLVVLENVRGLLSFGADSDLEWCPWCMGNTDPESALRAIGAVLGDLADLGFDAEWVLVPASDVGAPHRRERVFITAWPAADAGGERQHWRSRSGGTGRHQTIGKQARGNSGNGHRAPAQDPDRPTGSERRQPAPGQAPGWWPRADAGGPGGAPVAADTERDGRPGWPAGGAGEADESREGPRPAAEGRGASDGGGHTPADPGRTRLSQHPGEPSEEEAGTYPGDELAGDRGLRPAPNWGPYEPAIRQWESITGRPAPRPTEPGRTGERLSPRFVEWLMGLPDGWVTDVPGLTRNAQLKALGNGVVPQQAAAALRLLLPAVSERAA